MHKNIKSTKILLLISTIILVVLSAYYSVVGLSSLFAGKKLLVAIMAIGFLISKITILSLLTIYWKTLFKTIKVYFMFSAIALVLISSSGIYSYLSQAYFLTIKLANSIQNSTTILKNKILLLLQRKNNILKLNLLLLQQIQRLSKLTLNIRLESQRTKSILKFSNKKINNLLLASSIDTQIFALNDSTLSINNTSVNLHSGTFIQIARLFGVTIDQVAQFFLFLIILIFDPLAVLFVIVINLNLFNVTTQKNKDLYQLTLVDNIEITHDIENNDNEIELIVLLNNCSDDVTIELNKLPELIVLALFKKKDLE